MKLLTLRRASFTAIVLTAALAASFIGAPAARAGGPSTQPAAKPGEANYKPGYTDTPMLPNSKWHVHDRQRPQPALVDPGVGNPPAQPATPPSDAIVLFDGKDLSQWNGGDEKGVENGILNVFKTGELRTRQSFGDCQLHVEWATPAKADGGPMVWGNSGVFFLDKYELQIIESHDSYIYADGNAGAIYGQVPPLVNPSRKPGEWQSYDVVFTSPRFESDLPDAKLVQPAYFTVFQNGVLVQNHQAAYGPTGHRILPRYDDPRPHPAAETRLGGSVPQYLDTAAEISHRRPLRSASLGVPCGRSYLRSRLLGEVAYSRCLRGQSTTQRLISPAFCHGKKLWEKGPRVRPILLLVAGGSQSKGISNDHVPMSTLR